MPDKPVKRQNVEDLFHDTKVIMADRLDVFSWTPEKAEETGPVGPMQIHIVCQKFKFPGFAFVLRIKSRKACEELIEALQSHMDECFPKKE